ncbi:hypothetical protein BH24ACT23_BH24ACT23_08840 [soil metagenome]
MKRSDRTVLFGVVALGLAVAFWFLALAPKRERASELEASVATVAEELETQEALVAAALESASAYDRNYSSLVVLGKAAPPSGDTPGLIEQLSTLAERADASFDSLELAQGTAAEPATPASQTTTDQNQAADAAGEAPAAEAPADPALTIAPTEVAAAELPIGATVGPAGLGALPYVLKASGDYFQLADLLEGFDRLVGAGSGGVDVTGRLLTVNSFELNKPETGTALEAEFSVTSYVLPASQGLTAGATASSPPSSIPAAVPVASAEGAAP